MKKEMKNAMTLDGYVYTPIYHQPTTMNTMCVYRIQKSDEEPMYFLASSEMNEWFIKKSTFNQMKTHVMPQHYEGFFKDEFSAILMAKNIAMDSCIERQKSAFKKYEWSSRHGAVETNLTRNHEVVVGSIPGLPQRVKDPALL